MSYSVLVLLAVGSATVLDLVLLKTRLLRRRAFWVSYAIMLGFQLIMNGILTRTPVVSYNSAEIVGLRIVYAPIEDLGFGFALILATLVLWVHTGRTKHR